MRNLITKVWIAGLITGLYAIAIPVLANANDRAEVYIGGAIGESHVSIKEIQSFSGEVVTIREEKDSATSWQAFAGGRFNSWLGAELAYTNLGNVDTGDAHAGSYLNIRENAQELFAVLYAPTNAPDFDFYAKLGVARLNSKTVNSFFFASNTCINNGNCSWVTVTDNISNNGFAYGAGLQWRFSHVAWRLEYQRINASLGNPDALSLGAMWSF